MCLLKKEKGNKFVSNSQLFVLHTKFRKKKKKNIDEMCFA